MAQPHILIVSYPAQGHINPSLQLANKLIKIGVEVTFATSHFAPPVVPKASCKVSNDFHFAAISDGYPDGFKPQGLDVDHVNALKKYGPETLRNVIQASAETGRPVTCIVHTLILTWAAEVAREYHIPWTLLWIQPATVLGITYYYFNGYEDEIRNCYEPSWSIQMPGVPLLTTLDLPSFMLPSSSSTQNVALLMVKEQMKMIDEEENPYVLVNTFDALEPRALKAIDKYNLIGIGPLIDFPFSEGSGDVMQEEEYYMGWLESQPRSSVVYVAFGSLLMPSKHQMEEIARGLLECKRPFLWVIRARDDGEEEKLSCIKELEQKGLIVPWSSQIEVLKHPSLGCFVTHCGWNSTLETITLGVPVVAFPLWADQGTNAKLIQDVWRIGVRVVPNEDGLVESDEIKRCIELVMDGGENGLEFAGNAKKWKGLAGEAMVEGGLSDTNLKAFAFKDV
ncbi:crocetin glucosyltransferase, chloroplastic-like [Coffea arabica]|uniref:Glycosyltransferase n=1 Tax=Coffea arabica TaxID=13443 RepID=A0A6P6WY16_COFAR|nr:crocetin glucosyltransferase, chloroplastic-like [Coffea arabica]